MTKHGVITVSATAQKINTALGEKDIPVCKLTLQPGGANSGVLYFGGAGVSTSVFGFRMEIPASTIPSAPLIFDADAGSTFKLGDYYVVGTASDKLHVSWVPNE